MPAWAQTAEEEQAQAANQPEEAQTGGDLIIVTATKRASTVQDVPFSINAQTQEDIQRANANTIEDISRNVAGLTVQNLGPGQSQVSVRGVSAGQIVRDQPGVKEQVGVYLDESVVSLSLFTPDFDLFDLNRVETLRGPQGTLFGSGSVGGTLRYITNQPKLGRTEGTVEANVNHVHDGDFGGHLKGAINLPVGETLAVRAVGYFTKYGGFIDAVGPAAGKDVNDGKRVGGRLSLLWQPIAELKITPRIVYQ
jgi:iron complex outermembrane receptor protein